MATTLNGRVVRLEATASQVTGRSTCAAYELPHVPRPVPLATVEAIVGAVLCGRPGPGPLCPCSPCCGDGRAVARLTHGLPPEGTAWRP